MLARCTQQPTPMAMPLVWVYTSCTQQRTQRHTPVKAVKKILLPPPSLSWFLPTHQIRPAHYPVAVCPSISNA
jgi:hypothetical protein